MSPRRELSYVLDMASSRISDGCWFVDDVLLCEGVAPELRLEVAQRGAFVGARRSEAAARFRLSLGRPRALRRFLACHRYEPFWMKPKAGSAVAEIPLETQLLLLELDDGRVALLVPLPEAPFHVSLSGKGDELWAVADTGDPGQRSDEALLLYAAVGDDVHELVREGAALVAERLGARLLRDKTLPDGVDDFGWCTWDAFYQDVSHEKVREGLESFRAGGVQPRAMILDDGWQSVATAATGERRLTTFAANDKFPGGLAATVSLAKREYGVRTFYVWHAIHGYWGGAAAALPYGVTTTLRWYSPEILAQEPEFNCVYWGACVGRPEPEALPAFYDDYHRALAAEGVDGVKVDNQASIEGLAHGAGGRVNLMRQHRRALEASVRRNFAGRLINCMSCSSEMLYQADDSSLTRTSTDFWPNRPESHALHVYTNALVGLWFGEFVQPDWDMFQSGHPAGAYHAAARAVSGSPVYVSDKPGAHDFDLLRQLVLSDGSVPRARGVGRPTRDWLFRDPLREPVLLKVFNHNTRSAVVGMFNARGGEREPISGTVSPADVPGAADGDYALYLGRARRLLSVGRGESVEVSLEALEAEIATLARVERGIAPIGLVDKLNPGGTIESEAWAGETYTLVLKDGGELLVYSARRPDAVRLNGRDIAFEYEQPRLRALLEYARPCRVELAFS